MDQVLTRVHAPHAQVAFTSRTTARRRACPAFPAEPTTSRASWNARCVRGADTSLGPRSSRAWTAQSAACQSAMGARCARSATQESLGWVLRATPALPAGVKPKTVLTASHAQLGRSPPRVPPSAPRVIWVGLATNRNKNIVQNVLLVSIKTAGDNPRVLIVGKTPL